MAFWEKKEKSSGVFVASNGEFSEYTGPHGNGSFNQIGEGMGYEIGQLHSVIPGDNVHGVDMIAVFPLTRKVLFLFGDKHVSGYSKTKSQDIIGLIDWDFEYRPDSVENILDQAIEYKCWTVEFVNKIFASEVPADGLFASSTYGVTLIMKDGLLVGYEGKDGQSPGGGDFVITATHTTALGDGAEKELRKVVKLQEQRISMLESALKRVDPDLAAELGVE